MSLPINPPDYWEPDDTEGERFVDEYRIDGVGEWYCKFLNDWADDVDNRYENGEVRLFNFDSVTGWTLTEKKLTIIEVLDIENKAEHILEYAFECEDEKFAELIKLIDQWL